MAPRPSTSERARRLLALLPHLRDRGTRPLAEIASAIGTDESSVAEDLATLSLCGADERDPSALIAVYVEDGAAVVWGELPALERPVRLTAAEAQALLAALDALGVEQGGELTAALASVGNGAFDAEVFARTVRSAAAPGGLAHTHALLATCSSAGRTARIVYTPRGSGEATGRLVEPWRLFASRGAWYLHAFSIDAGAERTYRLDRISSVEPGTATFLPPADLPSADAAPDASSLPRAGVLFAHDGPDLGEREWPGAAFERRDDGTVLASVPYAGTSWIARKVAAWLGDAVVTSPAEVRAAVRKVASDDLAGLGGPVG
jgi:proteasome accessory factor C